MQTPRTAMPFAPYEYGILEVKRRKEWGQSDMHWLQVLAKHLSHWRCGKGRLPLSSATYSWRYLVSLLTALQKVMWNKSRWRPRTDWLVSKHKAGTPCQSSLPCSAFKISTSWRRVASWANKGNETPGIKVPGISLRLAVDLNAFLT